MRDDIIKGWENLLLTKAENVNVGIDEEEVVVDRSAYCLVAQVLSK